MRLKPRQIEAFKAVMMAGGITAAAEQMNITQPAVSRLIRDFEDMVRLHLFDRVGTRLAPTAEAKLLYGEIERLYLGLDLIAQAAEDIRQHKNTVLRIASITSLVRPYLHQAICEVIGDRLDIPLVIDVENSRYIWDMVERNHYDLGFVFASPRHTSANAVRLHRAASVAAVAPEHRLASHTVLTPGDLLDERMLIPGRNSPLRMALDRAFSSLEHQPVSTMETSMLNCCHFAAAGMGVGIVDDISLKASGANVVAIPFKPDIDVSYYAIRPSTGQKSEIINRIVENIMDSIP